MLDVLLLIVACAVSCCLPQRLFRTKSRATPTPVSTAFGLCTGIFSLSILDAVPVSWLAVLSHDTATDITTVRTYRSVTGLYWILLWICAFFVLVAVPGITGYQATRRIIAQSSRIRDFLIGMVPLWCVMVFRIVYIVLSRCTRIASRIFSRCRGTSSEPVLATTYTDATNGTDPRSPAVPRKFPAPQIPHPSTASAHPSVPNSGRRRLSVSIVLYTLLQQILALLPGLLLSFAFMATMQVVSPSFIQINDTSVLENRHLYLATAIAWMSTVGICISTVLNGFGTVSMPFVCFTGLFLKPIRPEPILRAEEEIQIIQRTLHNKRRELDQPTLKRSISATAGSAHKPFSTSKKGHIATFAELGDEIEQQKQIRRREIAFLESLVQEMVEDVKEMKDAQRLADASRTTMGKIRMWIGVVFSFLLLFRLYCAAVSIWHHHTANPKEWNSRRNDIVTAALLWLTGHRIVSDRHFDMLSQGVSLLLTIVLGVTQLRVFLRTVMTVNRRANKFYERCYCIPSYIRCMSHSGSESSSAVPATSLSTGDASFLDGPVSLHAHTIAALMICYWISCILFTHMMLPRHSGGFWTSIGDIDAFMIHDSMVHTIYAVSALFSASILAMALAIQRQNSARYNNSVGLGGGLSTTGKDSGYGPDAC